MRACRRGCRARWCRCAVRPPRRPNLPSIGVESWRRPPGCGDQSGEACARSGGSTILAGHADPCERGDEAVDVRANELPSDGEPADRGIRDDELALVVAVELGDRLRERFAAE